MARQKTREHISEKQIHKYWITQALLNGKELYNLVGDVTYENIIVGDGKECYCCGKQTNNLHKCHIFPHGLGGKEVPENMFLMCYSCHKNNPDTSYRDVFFKYIRDTPHYINAFIFDFYKGIMNFYEQSPDVEKAAFDALIAIDPSEEFIADMLRNNVEDKFVVVHGEISQATRVGLAWKAAVQEGSKLL